MTVHGRMGRERPSSAHTVAPETRPGIPASLVFMEPPLADDDVLRRHATVLTVLGETHGLTDLVLGVDPGELVATVAPGRTYFDVARFEMSVADVLGFTVHVTPSGAPGAHARASLAANAAA